MSAIQSSRQWSVLLPPTFTAARPYAAARLGASGASFTAASDRYAAVRFGAVLAAFFFVSLRRGLGPIGYVITIYFMIANTV